MGWAERSQRTRTRQLGGLKVAVDVQHLWKPPPHQHDRGAHFKLTGGATMWETDCSLIYAQALGNWLRDRGADVLENSAAPMSYGARNRAANDWGADAYLACHVNAGGGRYPLAMFMSTTPGEALGFTILQRITAAFPVLAAPQLKPLHSNDRGAVCIEACSGRTAAIVLEPFFGDRPEHQVIMTAPELGRLGRTIGEGLASWWEARPVA